jgi:hypothetical protein
LLHTGDIYPISSEFMAVAKKAKITFTCEPSLREGLEAWAEKESRTLSNLVELVIRQAYEARQELEPEPTVKPAAKTKPAAARTKREEKIKS